MAKEIHAGNQARVKAGVLAAVELLDSEFGVAQREQDLLAAEKSVKDASDSLSVLIQYGVGSELVPADSIPVKPMEVSEQGAMEIALRNRPDLQSAKDRPGDRGIPDEGRPQRDASRRLLDGKRRARGVGPGLR